MIGNPGEDGYIKQSMGIYGRVFINKILSVVVGGNPLPLGGGRSLVNS